MQASSLDSWPLTTQYITKEMASLLSRPCQFFKLCNIQEGLGTRLSKGILSSLSRPPMTFLHCVGQGGSIQINRLSHLRRMGPCLSSLVHPQAWYWSRLQYHWEESTRQQLPSHSQEHQTDLWTKSQTYVRMSKKLKAMITKISSASPIQGPGITQSSI